MIRSCAILYQAWTWAPKRNQVFSLSLISREGPRVAKVGTGDELGAGWAGAVSGGFSVWPPPGVCCAEAAPATLQTKTTVAAWWMKRFLPVGTIPMNSSSAGGCGGRSPSRSRGPVMYSTWRYIRNRPWRAVPQSETARPTAGRDTDEGSGRQGRGHHRRGQRLRPRVCAHRRARGDEAGARGRTAGRARRGGHGGPRSRTRLRAVDVRLRRQQARGCDPERDAVPRPAARKGEDERLRSLPRLRPDQHPQLGAQPPGGANARRAAHALADRGSRALGKGDRLGPAGRRGGGADDLRCRAQR